MLQQLYAWGKGIPTLVRVGAGNTFHVVAKRKFSGVNRTTIAYPAVIFMPALPVSRLYLRA